MSNLRHKEIINETAAHSELESIGISFPWLSPVFSALLVGVLIFINFSASLIDGLTEPYQLSIVEVVSIVIVFFVVITADIRRYLNDKRNIRRGFVELEKEVKFAWKSRKKIQQRTHIYSDHAEKLKRFISDKLIEQIEYDDKFLHFKSIAAEIRHNGVISYDIVRTALENAARRDEQKNNGEQGENALDKDEQGSDLGSDIVRSYSEKNTGSGAKQALLSMKYLWDLLDLSTADNIALHLGNYLVECEEQYYHLELNETSNESPSGLTFSPSYATVRAISPFLDADSATELSAAAEHQSDNVSDGVFFQKSGQFLININHTPSLLGNENHLILMIENLVKNAQFFSTKTTFKQKTDRIAIQLSSEGSFIKLMIYNRGPHIKEKDKDQIFQLGFSTRRAKEHHGKGLGLFFVNEIVKGYQGKINIENIGNREHTYTLRVALHDDTVITKVIDRRIENDRPQFRLIGDDNLSVNLDWDFEQAIKSIEVSSTVHPKTQVFDEFDKNDTTVLLDPINPIAPEWMLKVNRKNSLYCISFSALDINGVQFNVFLPTADARLSGDEFNLDDHLSSEVERLNSHFKEIEDF